VLLLTLHVRNLSITVGDQFPDTFPATFGGDTTGLSDTAAAARVFTATVDDTLAGSDDLARAVSVTADDLAGLADQAALGLLTAVDDLAGLVDQADRGQFWVADVDDLSSLADTVLAVAGGVPPPEPSDRVVPRPDVGRVPRPDGGSTSRPFAGLVLRP
jgi:hypothetical protein